MKLKVGDEVEIVKVCEGEDHQVIGRTGRIWKIDLRNRYPYYVDVDGDSWHFAASQLKLVSKEGRKNMGKFYKVIKDHPFWDVGAILEKEADDYKAISDLWDKEIKDGPNEYYETGKLVENQPAWFERVYNVSVLGKAKYLAKDAAKKAHEELHKP